ncbi:MAG: tetratricopeptide repeat protein [Bacteroidales bacterium]|nr:tetratricopeptide repeat protein [Bacteroidales bacterium]
MRRSLIITILLIARLCYPLLGTPQTDSLKIRLERASNDDAKINLLMESGSQLAENDMTSALELYNQALQLAQKTASYKKIAEINQIFGSLFFYTGNYDRVLTYYYDALENYEIVQDTSGFVVVFFNIALVYNNLGEYEKSREFYQLALEMDQPNENLSADTIISLARIRIHNNIGVTLNSEEKYDEALAYFYKAIELSERAGNDEVVPQAYNNIGNVHKAKKDYSIALSFYQEALKRRSVKEDPKGVALTYFYMGECYALQQENLQALNYFQKAFHLADSSSYTELKRSIAENMIDAFANLGLYKNSYNMHRIYKQLSDSINNAQSLQTATQLEMQYNFAKIQKQQELEQQKTELIYLLIIAIVAGLLAVAILFLSLVRNRSKRIRLQQEKLSLEKENLENKLEFKNKELATNVMYLVKSNETIINIIEKLVRTKDDFKKSNQSIIQEVINELRRSTSKDAWKEFELRFQEVHESFYTKLNDLFPDLTPNEQRLCAFLRLNMTTKEISAITFQSIKSIEVARTRLRKKLNLLNKDVNLVTYLMQIEDN